ncbi:MAG: right-handed parallel beta-helix repeat-containing protein, partial [Candidatus Heimdallarchaeota archaeon]|nr:right-handed parallel beta-helix repeat-containing protein [Candidatus Heimdallarchaeota archaeon]
MKGKQIFAFIGLTILILLLNQTISELFVDTNIRNVSALTPHGAIDIDSDDDFITLGFAGLGTKNKPYLITDFLINITIGTGIRIRDTTKYFSISNCHIETTASGIQIYSVSLETCKIENNTIISYSDGIDITLSEDSTIMYNTIVSEEGRGVEISESSGTICDDNHVTSKDESVTIYESIDVSMRNNIFAGKGIYLEGNPVFSTLIESNNTLNGKDFGFFR